MLQFLFMQSTLYSPTNSRQFHFPWRPHHLKPISKKLKLSSPRAPTLTASLRTSINYEPEEGLNEGPRPILPVRLPVVIRHSGRVSRYSWDGSSLKLVSVDGGALSFCLDFEDGFRKIFRVSSLAVRNFFIPKQVPDNYMAYVKWKLLHRVFSSALQVLATQVFQICIKDSFFLWYV